MSPAASLSAREIWSRLLDRARLELPEQTFKTWLEPTEPLTVDGATLFIGTPDQFAADWNEHKHADLLASLAPVALGHPIAVVFRVNEEQRTRPQMDLFVAPPPTSAAQSPGYRLSGAPSAQQVAGTKAPLSARYTFDYFVIGKSNELAAAAAHAVAQAPGKVYNPLFIYGSTGLGKTHLMHAVAHEIIRLRPETRVALVGTEQFTNDLGGSIQNRTTSEFRRRYREVDLLLVDDVHFLKGKEATQEEFFHTFNALYEAGRQIIISSDRPPRDIATLEARLRSRFEWGLITDIQPPDLETRIAILRKKVKAEGLDVTDPQVLTFVASRISTNIRELEGALTRVVAFSSLTARPMTVELAQEVLRDVFPQGEIPEVSVERIQEIVGERFGISLQELTSDRRSQAIVYPRQVAMYLCRELTDSSLPKIGKKFGGRDHTTVIHATSKIAKLIKEDRSVYNLVQELTARVKQAR